MNLHRFEYPQDANNQDARENFGDLKSAQDLNDLYNSMTFSELELAAEVCYDDTVAEIEKDCESDDENEEQECLESDETDSKKTEGLKECYEERMLEKMENSLKLIFGENPSPGFICGLKTAVVDFGHDFPGTCCLTLPKDQDYELWGLKYTCSETCNEEGPLFSGTSKESCDVLGGTWCPTQADCTTLQSCIEDMKARSLDNNQKALHAYLEGAPSITDASSTSQCGKAREYFGYDEYFINDDQICADAWQLRYSKDFSWMEDFFGGADEDADENENGDSSISCDCGNDDEEEKDEDREAVKLKDILPLLLDEPGESYKELPISAGKLWSAANFGISGALSAAYQAYEGVVGFECPDDFFGVSKNVCAGFKNVLGLILWIVKTLVSFGHSISVFMYGEKAELGNQEPMEVLEHVRVLTTNMEKTASWMEKSLTVLVTNQNTMAKAIAKNVNRRYLLTSTEHREFDHWLTSNGNEAILPLGDGSDSILSRPSEEKLKNDMHMLNAELNVDSKINEAKEGMDNMEVLESDITRSIDEMGKEMNLLKVEMKKEIKQTKVEMKKEIKQTKVEMKKEIKQTKVEMKKEMDDTKVEIKKQITIMLEAVMESHTWSKIESQCDC